MFGKFFDFGGEFFGRIFLGDFFLEEFFGRHFWENFLGRIYWEEFIGRIDKELMFLSRFWGNFVSMQGRRRKNFSP